MFVQKLKPTKTQIDKIYEQYNFPASEKLYKLVKRVYPDVEKKTINDFYNSDNVTQVLMEKRSKRTKKSGSGHIDSGHIVAYDENDVWQIDLFNVRKYKKANDSYEYLFCVVDVFTRKLYVTWTRSKTKEELSECLKTIIDKAKGQRPNLIMSDNESSFKSDMFDQIVPDTILDFNLVNDHHALGIIDNMAKHLKKILAKYRLKYDQPRWLDIIDTVVKNYNNTPNSSILSLSPNEASLPENSDKIFQLNLDKGINNISESDLKVGDKVRISTISNKLFQKSDTPIWSPEVYLVVEVHGKKIQLDNKKVYKRENLLAVPLSSETIVIAKTKKTVKDHKVDTILKNKDEGIDRNDDVSGVTLRNKKDLNQIQLSAKPAKPAKPIKSVITKSPEEWTDEIKNKVFKDDNEYFKIENVYKKKIKKRNVLIADVIKCYQNGKTYPKAKTDYMALKEVLDLLRSTSDLL